MRAMSLALVLIAVVSAQPAVAKRSGATGKRPNASPAGVDASGNALRRVPHGSFLMGASMGEPYRHEKESQHWVTLTHDFLVQTTEVTQYQWEVQMGNNPSRFEGDKNRPVEKVSWYDAVTYANALSVADGLPKAYDLSSCSGAPGMGNIDFAHIYDCFDKVTLTASTPYATIGWRLPTEAEWEYAYRAGSSTPWFFGSDRNLLEAYAWVASNADKTTHPVGEKKPNAWGLYDMAGNVYEWCWDNYGPYPDVVNDPVGSGWIDNTMLGPMRYRVMRGGSYASSAVDGSIAEVFCRAARRDMTDAGLCTSSIGFRLVRTVR